jgi:hypothetical protein
LFVFEINSKAVEKRGFNFFLPFLNRKISAAVSMLTCYQGNWHHTSLVIKLSFVSEYNKVQLLQDLKYVCKEAEIQYHLSADSSFTYFISSCEEEGEGIISPM